MTYPTFLERGPVLKLDRDRTNSDHQAVLDRLAFMVGLVAFGLPIVMILGATLGGSCFRDSISHFYHAQFLGGIFVGLLFFVGGFLIAYSGKAWIEGTGSTIAGLGAAAVALFPTAGSGCELLTTFKSRAFVMVTNPTTPGSGITVAEINPDPAEIGENFFRLFGEASDYHMVAAGILFAYLGVYCLLVLRRVIPEIHGEGETLLQSKRDRNVLYFWCGVVILACVALLALRGFFGVNEAWWNSLNLTFWVELVALWAFGLAWVTKGRIFEKLNDDPSATAET